MEQRLSLITLGVADLARSRRFYERLGWTASKLGGDEVVFFQLGGVILSLWSRASLAADMGVKDEGRGFGSVAIAHNVRTKGDVDALLKEAESAGARILKERGTLILACECREGVPPNSHLDQLLRSASSPEEILTLLATPGFVRPEQWQAQIQALIQRKADVYLYSSLPDDVVRACHLNPCRDIAEFARHRLDQFGPEARIAVLPLGPDLAGRLQPVQRRVQRPLLQPQRPGPGRLQPPPDLEPVRLPPLQAGEDQRLQVPAQRVPADRFHGSIFSQSK